MVKMSNRCFQSEWPLILLVLHSLFSLSRAVPVCPRDAVPGFSEDNVMSGLGVGFDAAKHSAATARVVKLTTSSQVFRLPNGKTAPIPCEASRNWFTVSDQSDLNVIITNLDSFNKSVARPLATLSLSEPDLTSDMHRLHRDIAKPYTVRAIIYRDTRLAVASLPMKSDLEITESRSWWSDDFNSSLYSLNRKGIDNSYQLFISTYGTHLVTDIYIGGYIVLSGSVDYCQYSAAGGSAAEQEKAIQALSSAINVQYGVSSAQDSNYLVRDTSVAAGGGDFRNFKLTANAQKYLLSVGSTATSPPPAVTANTVNFVPLWKLLPSNDPRRQLLRNATDDYISTFGVASLKNTRPVCRGSGNSKDDEVVGLAVLAAILFTVIVAVMVYQGRVILRTRRRQKQRDDDMKGYETFKDTMKFCDECNAQLKCQSCKELIKTYCDNAKCSRSSSIKNAGHSGTGVSGNESSS